MIDVLIVILLVISGAVSTVKGFLREFVSVSVWLIAIGVTLLFSSRFSSLLPADSIESPTARLSISALTLFFGFLMVGSLFNWLLQKMIQDRPRKLLGIIMGFVFGVVRGALIVAFFVLLAHLVPSLQQETWWENSNTLSVFEDIAESIHGVLPTELAKHFDFSPTNT